jgi:hypothetical protein
MAADTARWNRPNGQNEVWVVLLRPGQRQIRVNAMKVRAVEPDAGGHSLIIFQDGRKIRVVGEPNAVSTSLGRSLDQTDNFCMTGSGMSKLA